jgi:hypothetical protein
VSDHETGSEAGASGAADEPDGGEELDIDRQWNDARANAGLDPLPETRRDTGQPGAGALLSPYLVLYAGFFLGPAGAFVSSLGVGPRDLSVRRVAVMFGICGAIWCGIQGTTAVLAAGPALSDVGLQAVRSGFNFAGAVLLILFWRRELPGRFRHSRRAVKSSVVVGLVMLVLFVSLPTSVLGVLGR